MLEAEGGTEALHLGEAHEAPIDLLITDVIMPRMSGKELANRLAEKHPETRVLYISGYSEDVTIRRGLIGEEAELLPKPFTMRELLGKVREILGREDQE